MDRDYAAICIAAEMVRIKIAVAQHLQAQAQGRDVSPLLTRPLGAVAAALGITEQVEALIADALRGAGGDWCVRSHAMDDLDDEAA